MKLGRTITTVAVGGAALALIGAGVASTFTDSGSATEKISVGTFGCALSSTDPSVNIVGNSISITLPTILSSQAGSETAPFTLTSTGSIPAYATWSASQTGNLSGRFTPLAAPAAAALTAPENATGGFSWTELQSADLGTSGAVVYTATCSEVPFVFESLGSTTGPLKASAVTYTPSSALTLSGITDLHSTYAFTTGDCHGGSLRWSIELSTGKNIFVYFGAAPSFTDCTTVNQSGVNMVATGDLRVDTSQVPGGTFYGTWADALTLAGSVAVTAVDLVIDSGWGGNQVLTLGNVSVNGNVWTPTGGGLGFTEIHP